MKNGINSFPVDSPIQRAFDKEMAKSRAKQTTTVVPVARVPDEQVAPGWVVLEPLKLEEVSEGGIVLPGSSPEKNIDRLQYGRVVGCGSYCASTGLPVEMKHFPLPAGTIVEIMRMNPWVASVEQRLICKTSDVTRYWLPPNKPKFFQQLKG